MKAIWISCVCVWNRAERRAGHNRERTASSPHPSPPKEEGEVLMRSAKPLRNRVERTDCRCFLENEAQRGTSMTGSLRWAYLPRERLAASGIFARPSIG